MAGKRTIAVAMSGGVDSSTAALLLLRHGFSVLGITMPTGKSAIDGAQRVANFLGIEHMVASSVAEVFEEAVVKGFIRGYLEGMTPNPCIICNRMVKYGALMDFALEHADYFATGHYARIVREADGEYALYRGVDPRKDQSYVLFSLNQVRLARLILPLGGMRKEDVRSIGQEAGIPFIEEESQEICFVPGDDYRAFLKLRCGEDAFLPGPIRTVDGTVVGHHQGLPFYTLGQRRGLGVALGKRGYVVGFDKHDNALIFGGKHDLETSRLDARDVSYISGRPPGPEFQADVQIRYNARPVPARVKPRAGGLAEVSFEKPQTAVTPGQAVVFYQGAKVIGGGIITGSPIQHRTVLPTPGV